MYYDVGGDDGRRCNSGSRCVSDETTRRVFSSAAAGNWSLAVIELDVLCALKFDQIPLFDPRGGAAPLRGIAPIATLERFVSLLLVRADYICRAPGRGPEGKGNCSSCYGDEQR